MSWRQRANPQALRNRLQTGKGSYRGKEGKQAKEEPPKNFDMCSAWPSSNRYLFGLTAAETEHAAVRKRQIQLPDMVPGQAEGDGQGGKGLFPEGLPVG